MVPRRMIILLVILPTNIRGLSRLGKKRIIRKRGGKNIPLWYQLSTVYIHYPCDMSLLDTLLRSPIINGSYRQTYPYQVSSVFGYAYISQLFWLWSTKCDPNMQYGEMMNMHVGGWSWAYLGWYRRSSTSDWLVTCGQRKQYVNLFEGSL